MKLPIFVIEGLDISVFRTVEEAERKLEPLDVRNGIFRIFDASGQELAAEVVVEEGPSNTLLKRIERILLGSYQVESVRIHEFAHGTSESYLFESLRCLLEHLGVPGTEICELSLEELIERTIGIMGYVR